MIFKVFRTRTLSLILCVFIFFGESLFAWNPSSKQWRKIDKHVFQYFNMDVEKNAISFPSDNSSYAQFYTLKNKGNTIGYLVTDRAPSKFEKFDFIVILDTEVNIKMVRVITYREDWGFEICNKRWLEQFIDNDRNTVDSMLRVDGISGSTISVNSLTHHIDGIIDNINSFVNN